MVEGAVRPLTNAVTVVLAALTGPGESETLRPF